MIRFAVKVRLLGQAEVADLGNPVDGQEHVRRLQVTVDDPLAMCMLDGAGECRHHLGRGPGRRRLPRQLPVQAAATHVFLDDEKSALVSSGAEDLYDMGVLEPGQRRGLNQ